MDGIDVSSSKRMLLFCSFSFLWIDNIVEYQNVKRRHSKVPSARHLSAECNYHLGRQECIGSADCVIPDSAFVSIVQPADTRPWQLW
jgi:hypothetical protein